MKKMLTVGAACLALVGCNGTQDTSQSTTTTRENAAQTTETIQSEAVTATAQPAEPAESTEEPPEAQEDDLVDAELVSEDDPDPDEIAALVDELVKMSERQYKRKFMRPLVDEIGEDEFCRATEFTGEAIDNPGGDLVLALFFGAALSDNTTEDSYTEEQMRRLAEWTNDVYADVCGWEPPVVVHDPGEAGANDPDVLELLDGTIAGYTMSTWGERVRSQDPATQEQYCQAIETGADLSFAAQGLDVTREEAAAIGIWTMNEMFDTCYG